MAEDHWGGGAAKPMGSDRLDRGMASLTDRQHEPVLVTYLPESYYFEDTAGLPAEMGARVTADCVARWADRYWARPLINGPARPRIGKMPPTPAARHSLLDRVFDWLRRTTGGRMEFAALILSAGGVPILDAHDGLPGKVRLSPTEFADLQRCWERHGLPQDLYYPAEEERTVVEPVEKYGGTVRMYRSYSPLQWAHRDHAAIEAQPIPTEEQRRERFAEECDRFSQALMLRAFEALEPGPSRNLEEGGRMIKLSGVVQSLAHATRHPEERPSEAPTR